ncbi:MAG: hypothetical protein Q9227_005043 [Pyrenula ochraceoflavens]
MPTKETATWPPSSEELPDPEKRQEQDELPDKVAPKNLSPYDADSSKDSEDETKKERKGGLGDYFVSAELDADYYINLMLRLSASAYSTTGTKLIVSYMQLELQVLLCLFNNHAVGHESSRRFEEKVNHLVLYFVYLFVGRFVIGYVATLCICVAAARTTNSLRKAFLENLLRQEVSYFDKPDNGSPATQVTTNGYRVNQGIAEKLYTLVMGISLFFSSYIVALAVQWKLALIIMSIVPANILVIVVCIGIDAPIEARIVKLYSQAATVAQDALGSIKTIHAFGAQRKVVEHYNQDLQTAHQEGNKKTLIYGVMFSVGTFLVMSGTALAFWEGFRMFQGGEIKSIGTVFTVVLSVTLGATSLLLIFPQTQTITSASSAAAELFSIMDKPSLLDPLSSDGQRPNLCSGNIEIRNLNFAYPARPTVSVLQDLTLSIPSGKSTALVGSSGCGKSTLIGLLERWYQPTSGQILLDGCDIADLNVAWLRSNIRLVQQEPTLYQGTVFQNVAQGFVGRQLDLSREQQMHLVQKSCIAANAHDFIRDLPDGYNTYLGESASMLSGGQRQRISIARSIISDPKILLLDEATSALDPQAEKTVQNAHTCVSADKTTLIIAHKLATVMAADNIAVMANGRIVEQGTHGELLERDGLYAAMVRTQDLGVDAEDQVSDEETDERTYQDGSDRALSQTLSLQRTQSEAMAKNQAPNIEADLTSGTVGYSLLKCILVMLTEQRDLYKYYSVVVLASLIGGGTYPAEAVLFSRLINVFTLQGSEASQQANFYALMFFVLALANLFGYFFLGTVTNIIGQSLTHRYRREMVERMVHFDQDFFDHPENSSGALTARLSSVPSALQELISVNLGLIVNVMVNIVSTSVLAIVTGWKLGLATMFAGIFLIVGGGYVRIRLDQKLEALTEQQFASTASLATEVISSIRTINSLTLETSTLRQYSDILDAIVFKVTRSLVLTLIPYCISQSAEFLVMALGFWYGSRLVAAGEYSTTQFFVIFLAMVFGGQGAAQLFSYSTSITKAKSAANYILWLRNVKANISETEGNRDRGPPTDAVSVEIEKVRFRYRQRAAKEVLRGISMNIEPGAFAAFVGASGSGKSTIISLLERFYDPTSGSITLSEEDISLMSPALLRQHISLVQQEPPLYLGSVRDNIAMGLDYDPSEEEVLNACRQANVFDLISSLPEGLNTPCGSRGYQFSGGQRQRIAVARALIRKPRLLLLDEATSALDTQSEQIVQRALDEAAEGRTTIAVAHRLSTIRRAGVIFVLRDGRIVERGTHDELQRRRGVYYAMCLAQSLDQV